MTQGIVINSTSSGNFFIAPDGTDPTDRSTQHFIHAKALERSGIAPRAVMAGSRVEYETVASRWKDGRPEGTNIRLLEI